MPENKVWYEMVKTEEFKDIPGLIIVDTKNFDSYFSLIEETIEAFNCLHRWDQMWDINDARTRVKDKHVLYLGTDEEGILAHLWSEKNYLYNVFIHPRRKDNYSVRFCKACINHINYKKLSLYCDEWNIKAQKFFEKVGFTKI